MRLDSSRGDQAIARATTAARAPPFQIQIFMVPPGNAGATRPALDSAPDTVRGALRRAPLRGAVPCQGRGRPGIERLIGVRQEGEGRRLIRPEGGLAMELVVPDGGVRRA